MPSLLALRRAIDSKSFKYSGDARGNVLRLKISSFDWSRAAASFWLLSRAFSKSFTRMYSFFKRIEDLKINMPRLEFVLAGNDMALRLLT